MSSAADLPDCMALTDYMQSGEVESCAFVTDENSIIEDVRDQFDEPAHTGSYTHLLDNEDCKLSQ